jgi:hypothetical protein
MLDGINNSRRADSEDIARAILASNDLGQGHW